MDCPTYETLAQAAFFEATLAGLDAHIRGGCQGCGSRWSLLQRMQAAVVAGELPEVPAPLRRAAEGIAAERMTHEGAGSRARGLLTSLKVFVAELIPPVGPGLVPAVRRSSTQDNRQLFRVGPYDIDLALTPDRSLLGQIITTGDEPLDDARCTLSGTSIQQTALESTGEFRFLSVEPGTVSLTFEWDGTRVLIPEVGLPD